MVLLFSPSVFPTHAARQQLQVRGSKGLDDLLQLTVHELDAWEA